MLASVGVTGAALSACGNDQSVELNPTPFPDVAGAPPTLAPPPASPPAGEEPAAGVAPTEAAAEGAPTQAAAEEAPAGGAAAGGAGAPLALEALDPYEWDKDTLEAAPGQAIQITNVGLSQHNFVVDEWELEQDLPNGEPVEVTVPDDAEVGASLVYYCSIPGHREGGMEGTLTVIEAAAAGAAPAQQAPAPAAGGGAPAASGGGGPIALEALDPYEWDKETLEAAPGQVIQITNVGLSQHNFVVDEWGVKQDLPRDQPVEVAVPGDATAGASFVYYCSIPGHREGGMEGTLTIV